MKMDPQEAASVSVAVGSSAVPSLAPPLPGGGGNLPSGGGPPPRGDFSSKGNGLDTAANLANNIRALKAECARLKHQLSIAKGECRNHLREVVPDQPIC